MTTDEARRHDPARDRWHPLPVGDVRRLLAGTSAWLSGGVALDLVLGRTTREHGDIDVSVTSSGWPALRARLDRELDAFAAESGMLSPLAPGASPTTNTWFADAAGRWRLQVNLEIGDDAGWRYRRDERIRLPWRDAVLDLDGLAVVAPEVQLLWKSRAPGEKDRADWASVLPTLPAERVRWLLDAVRVAHPRSPLLD
jgi:hypothetical protein